jgi:hypothetical protein
MNYRYYLYRSGAIVFGDDIDAADLQEAIKTVEVLRDLRHEATDGFEIWSRAAMLYGSAAAPIPTESD